ncbi:MAG TPA: cytochrome c biogenesis protein CcsA [Candidatus Dormibacteraeota bacterium]|nr:cytochrome c biogenesis protein CcsA [Candidatus Dormibacteraeota bacterium]
MLPAVGLGAVFHFVSIVESTRSPDGSWSIRLTEVRQVESLLAFVLIAFFFGIYTIYRTASPGIAIFPFSFVLTLSAQSYSGPGPSAVAPSPFSLGWVYIHIALIIVGYSALIVSFIASILYLIQEKSLKAKGISGFWSRLPALATIDEIGYRCLIFGFPFMTFGLIAGSILAEAKFGAEYFKDPKVLLSALMWLVYTILLYTRWSAGWRGRRAAYLAACAFAAAAVAWVANIHG